MAVTDFRDGFVEKHVSTMRRWEILPEPRLHNARHMPDGLSCKNAPATSRRPRCRPVPGGAPMSQTAHDKWQGDQSPRRAGKQHKRQHPPNTQTLAKHNTDKQYSDHFPAKNQTNKKTERSNKVVLNYKNHKIADTPQKRGFKVGFQVHISRVAKKVATPKSSFSRPSRK